MLDPQWSETRASDAFILHIYMSSSNQLKIQVQCESRPVADIFFEKKLSKTWILTYLGPKWPENWAFMFIFKHLQK